MAPLKRFPEGPVTPHGAYHILHDRIPQMGLRSFDDTVLFNLLGGLSIPDKHTAPGRVEVKDIKGLIPPWRTIDQKGATQDGTTFVDSLYDPADVELNVRVKGKDPADCRRVARYLIDSLDTKRQSELWWFTHQLGRWWAPVRWYNTPRDPVGGIRNNTQDLGLRLRADNAFWQSYPSIDQFVFTYATASDDFEYFDADDLGANWTVALSGPGTGNLSVDGGQVNSNLQNGRVAVARRNGYTSTTNNQVVEMEVGLLNQWFYPFNAYEDIWARMNNTGTPGTSGIRLRIMRHKLILSRFVAGVETVLRETILFFPVWLGEVFRIVAGEEGSERTIKVMRGGATIWSIVESGTGSLIGASNRSAGLGLHTPGGEYTPSIRSWSAGDNSTVSQSGFLTRCNVGDQPMWDRYTVFGPGTFRFWNGPNAGVDEYVEFGPLVAGQVMQLRTDPRKRGVVDLTSTPATPAQMKQYESSLLDILSFAGANNAGPLADVLGSILGGLGTGAVVPPQGNPYSMLRGRWSKPLDPKSPGKIAEQKHVKVSIDNGNADSKILVAGTPLRRMPF